MFNAWKSFQSLSVLHWVVISLSLLLTFTAWQVSSRIAEAAVGLDYTAPELNSVLTGIEPRAVKEGQFIRMRIAANEPINKNKELFGVYI